MRRANGDVDLVLDGKVVSRCFVDTAFGIEIHEKDRRTTIRIGGHLDIEHARVRLSLSGENPAEAGQACILVGKAIAHAVARKDGNLEVTFTDGTKLGVAVDPDYEAWQANADDGFMVVSLPGGGLSVWSGGRGEKRAPRE